MRTCSDVQELGKGAPITVFDKGFHLHRTASAFDVCPVMKETAAAYLSSIFLSNIKIISLVLAKITRDDDGLKNTTMYLYDKTIESWGAQLIHRCEQRPHSRRRPRHEYVSISTLHPLAVVDMQSQRPVVVKKSRHRRHFCSEIDFIEELLDANKHLIYHSADSLQHESAVTMGALICIRISGDEWTDQNCHGQMHMPTAER